MRALVFGAALGLMALSAADYSAWAGPADDLIAANREAMGGAAWDGKKSLAVQYRYEGQGLTGTIHSLTDLETGRYADSYEIGPLAGADGFDGTRAWSKDMSGSVTFHDLI